jgi:hypothetical protein
VKSWVNTGVVEAGSVLARVEFLRPDEPDTVTLQPVFAYEQVFRYVDQNGEERWLTVGDAMNAIGPQVFEAVGYVLSAHVEGSKRDVVVAQSVSTPAVEAVQIDPQLLPR